MKYFILLIFITNLLSAKNIVLFFVNFDKSFKNRLIFKYTSYRKKINSYKLVSSIRGENRR